MNFKISFYLLLQLCCSYSWGQTSLSKENYVKNGVLFFSIWKTSANEAPYLKENVYLDEKGNIIRHDYVSAIIERPHQCYFSYDSCGNVVLEKWIDSSTKDSSSVDYSYTYKDCRPISKKSIHLPLKTSYCYDSYNILTEQVNQYTCETINPLIAIFRKDLDFLNWRGHGCGFETIHYYYSNSRLTSTVKTKLEDNKTNLSSIETYHDTVVYSSIKANFQKIYNRNNLIKIVLRYHDGKLVEHLTEDESIYFVYSKLGLLTEELYVRLNVKVKT